MTNVPDWLAALAIIIPSVTAFGGYWLAGRNEERRDERAAGRELAARREASIERLSEQRHDFQRDLLLELQDAMLKEVRAIIKVSLQDLRTLRKDGQVYQIGTELDAEAYDAGVDFRRLMSRVLDDDLRSALEDVHRLATEGDSGVVFVLENRDPDATIARIEAKQKAMTDRYAEVHDLLGVHLRAELGRLPDHWSEPPELTP